MKLFDLVLHTQIWTPFYIQTRESTLIYEQFLNVWLWTKDIEFEYAVQQNSNVTQMDITNL
jgi:hypothetical protein